LARNSGLAEAVAVAAPVVLLLALEVGEPPLPVIVIPTWNCPLLCPARTVEVPSR
jgi:hypothetical protein